MPALDQIIHQPSRLRIMAALVALDAGDQVEFTFLRNLLGLTDGNLGAHLQKLEAARYIRITKSFVRRKPRSDIGVTPTGRTAFENHVTALEQIIGVRDSPRPQESTHNHLEKEADR